MAIVDKNIVLFVGGVGGAKLALGLSKIVDADHLTIIVNVADDFWHHGLRICPDLDTIMYTLSGLVDRQNGWGIAGDTTTVLENIRRYDVEPWFRLGDQDLATHLVRTELLREGKRLTDVIQFLTDKLGIKHPVLPVTDDEIATIVHTEEHGALGFQVYFVKYRWQPTVKHIEYHGIQESNLSADVKRAVENADIIIVGPSNPWLSIAPILEVPGMRELLEQKDIPRIAVTPIIGGDAVKGPAAKIMRELKYEVSSDTVAMFYGSSINGFINDIRNEPVKSPVLRVTNLDTLMLDEQSKIDLSMKILNWLEDWK